MARARTCEHNLSPVQASVRSAGRLTFGAMPCLSGCVACGCCYCRRFMWDNLFKHVDIPPQNVHILDGMAEDLQAECDSVRPPPACFVRARGVVSR